MNLRFDLGQQESSQRLCRPWRRRPSPFLLLVIATSLVGTARGGDDPCENFQGPFDECVGPFIPGATATSATGYPEGITPFSHPGEFPLIQVCTPPVAGDGEDCPPCLFGGLFVNVRIYPRVPNDFICDIIGLNVPPADMSIAPPLDTPGLLPSGACPLELTLSFPDQSVVCPGHLERTGLIYTRSEPIDQSFPGGASSQIREFGFLLICVKPLEEAIARSFGVISIVRYPEVVDKPQVIAIPFAIANRSKSPHKVTISLDSTAPWPLLTALPSALFLEGGESTTVFAEYEIPAGAAVGESNTVTLTVDLDGLPDTAHTEVVEVILEEPQVAPIPAASNWGLIVMAQLLLIVATIGVGRRRQVVAA